MRGGYFRAYRKMFDPSHEFHPQTNGEPACPGYAWLDLCSMAKYEDSGMLKRGQLYGSARTLAKRWRWSKSKASRWLGRQRDAKRVTIETQAGRKASVITICNYDTYNPIVELSGTQAGHKRDTTRSKGGTRRSNKEEKKVSTSGKTTWLTPYVDIWHEVYGPNAEPNCGKLSRALDAVHKKHGVEKVSPEWRGFLQEHPNVKFLDVHKFAEGFGRWAPKPQQELPYLNAIGGP